MQKFHDEQHKDMKLQIQGLIPPGQQLHRNVLFDQLYASIPKDPEAKVQIYTAELAPKGWTNFHCHNGATFFPVDPEMSSDPRLRPALGCVRRG